MAATTPPLHDRPERLGLDARLTRGLRDYGLLLRRHRVILFVTMATTMMHSLTTKAVDIVLVFLLLVGSVTGAQFGSQLAVKAKPEILRLILAAIVLMVAFRMFLGLFYQPDEIYTIYPL